jgi:hypothetical protein
MLKIVWICWGFVQNKSMGIGINTEKAQIIVTENKSSAKDYL